MTKKLQHKDGYTLVNRPSRRELRELPALSVKQPYADWIVSGEKDIEYRTWRIKTPQEILIHASRLLPVGELREIARDLGDEKEWMEIFRELPEHGIIGKVRVVSCEKDSDGTYQWKLANPVTYRWIYCCPGGLKLFRVQLK